MLSKDTSPNIPMNGKLKRNMTRKYPEMKLKDARRGTGSQLTDFIHYFN